MTGLVQSGRATEDSALQGVDALAALTPPPPAPVSPEPRRQGWHTIGWFACGAASFLAIAWFIFFSRGELGAKAEWFFGAAVFCVALVTMWQTLTVQRQANQHAAAAAERLRIELVAAEERTAREIAMTQALHRVEMEAREKVFRAEVEAQRELARVERMHLLNQLQKQAMVEVSRAVNGHTQMLATLWNEGARILRIEDRDEREQAMNPIFEQISRVVNDFSVEVSNANVLIEDDRLHRSLNQVNEAAVMAIRVAEDVHDAVVDGRTPKADSIRTVQRIMQTRAAEARRLAWELLRNGLE
ncbi:hypothetical protein Mycsm_05895 [Mycobacterium sp. JS623]|uniref:hypothetical protein n=1 Tax=Mycobacterium sp. JS623 TaxID=212767 RepID=UPI0002A56A08|nr:hypothetical protein [Mycobacterium sp. JS623]AGB26062.1 hypothetical protein Mycsm_05895 [Mycobacterium sp. JS623]